jgi:hypothetical protein
MNAYFEQKASFCVQFGATLTARLLRHLLPLIYPRSARSCRTAGSLFPLADNLPLRHAGGMHPPLLSLVFSKHETFLAEFINRTPQTNEVRRAAGLIAATY